MSRNERRFNSHLKPDVNLNLRRSGTRPPWSESIEGPLAVE